MNLNRRQFIKSGALAGGAFGLNLIAPFIFQRQLLAADPGQDKKMIFIFQRGGNDGINTVIPRGDPDYNSAHRPTLYIPETQAIDTGNGFAQFHPSLQPMMEIYNHSGLNGRSGPGNLAVLHRVGYADQSQSHFDSQQYWENGKPGDSDLDQGFIYRRIESAMDLSDKKNSFVAASISSSQMVALKGPSPLPNFREASDFSFAGNPAQAQKFLGRLPSQPGGNDGSGLLGLYGGTPDQPGKRYRPLVHQTGQLLGATIETLQAAVNAGAYIPANGAIYPDNDFGRKLQQAAMLLKRTPARVLGMNIGGWDTHSSQGQINGEQGRLLGDLAMGFQALYRDLQDQWENLIVVTMTEFGRTTVENGSRGTDHGESSTVFVAGGGVQGGIYNCDPGSWKPGDMFSGEDRYLQLKTDFRAVFSEIFTRHFGDSPGMMNAILPGYDQAVAARPAEFEALNFLG